MSAKLQDAPNRHRPLLKDQLLSSFEVSQHCKMEIKWCSYVMNLQLRIHRDRVGKCAEGLNVSGIFVKRFENVGMSLAM